MSILWSVVKGVFRRPSSDLAVFTAKDAPVAPAKNERTAVTQSVIVDDGLVTPKHRSLPLAEAHSTDAKPATEIPRFHIYHVDINNFHKLYVDLIEALAGGLRDLSFACSVGRNEYVPGAVNILVGSTIFASRYHDLPNKLKGKPYIVNQLEQLDDRHGLLGEWPEYWELLKSATAIWDYAPSSVKFLKERGLTNVYHVPPAFHRCLDVFRPRPRQDIDVLYYGSVHDRRLRIIRALKERGVNVVYLPDTFGEERNRYIERSKVILNIHAWDDLNVLETVRLSFLLANRSFVISEVSDHDPYEGGVVYAPYDELVDTCIRYLQGPRQTREEIAQRGYLSIRKQEMAGILENVLDSMGEPLVKASSLATSDGSAGAYFLQPRPDIVELVPPQAKRILDVGCAGGEVGAGVKRRQNCHVTGIEIVATAAQQAAKHLDVAICGNAFDVLPSLPDVAYDCVVMADVLEHVEDSMGLLRLAARKLVADGCLVLCVPNVGHWSVVQGLLEGRWDYADQGILDRTHLRFFTLSSLLNILEESGFHVVHRRATMIAGAEPSPIVVEASRQYCSARGHGEADIHAFQFQLICRKL